MHFEVFNNKYNMANNSNYDLIFKVDKFESFKLDSKLSKFDINENTVVFFDLENNQKTFEYIKNQFETLHEKFKEVERNFIFMINLDYPENILNLIKFYLPFLTSNQLRQFNFEDKNLLKSINLIAQRSNKKPNKSFFKSEYQSLLDYVGYNGDIKCGFLYFENHKAGIIECNSTFVNNSQELIFDNLLTFFKTKMQEVEKFDCMIADVFSLYDNLNDEAKEKIREIENQLLALRNSGQLLFALPILKDILNVEANKMNIYCKSNLEIDEEYRISLPHFNDLQIHLSHLTKAVYILFYKNPQGINIKQLHIYKKELVGIYSSISNQINYDKILQSIDELVKPESKAIYTHISRIKSAFCKQMDYHFAKNFIVAGKDFGNDFKYIAIIKEDTPPIDLNEFYN